MKAEKKMRLLKYFIIFSESSYFIKGYSLYRTRVDVYSLLGYCLEIVLRSYLVKQSTKMNEIKWSTSFLCYKRARGVCIQRSCSRDSQLYLLTHLFAAENWNSDNSACKSSFEFFLLMACNR